MTERIKNGVYVITHPNNMGLTPRQTEILSLLACGLRAKEVGAMLGITERTVEAHTGKMLAVLGAMNTAHAVALAITAGLVDMFKEPQK